MIPAMKTQATRWMILMLGTVLVFGHAAVSQEKIDFNAFLKETQQSDAHNGKTAFVWFVPPELWEESAVSAGSTQQAARKAFAPLHDYRLFIVGVGSVGAVSAGAGNVDWLPDGDVRKNVVLRDGAGHTYAPVEKVSADAQALIDVIRPTFKNIMGPAADGLHLLFFPIKDAAGQEFGDPHHSGELSLVVSKIMDPGTRVYTWRFPLNSLAAPRYCPVGKERVEASWKYCPWHGNKLDVDAPTATPAKAK
jgi:hypothetical protein